ncbi:PaaI family thioesterase [Mucisphaera sp.]|uniref:PaaI family thioesterase n=1 Tax=Mucisphaera sp. TaxID=2913024 RepID=UPI003D0BB0E6
MTDFPTSQAQAHATTIAPDAGSGSWWSRCYERWEARLSRLSTRNRFWQKLFSMVFLPLAYRSGIRFIKGDESSFSAILPFRRFNRNWYNAMAGGALLGNAEVAGGMYVFEKCGADYTVVCKHLEYTFRRPCFGPAVYRITPRQNIDELVATGSEFNLTVDMQILQMVASGEHKERRVGQSTATFHVTPKSQARKHSQKLKLVTKRQTEPDA